MSTHRQSILGRRPKKIGITVYTMEATVSVTRPSLSAREIEVLRMWLVSDTKDAAARTLFISGATVNTHITRIRDKYETVGRPAVTKATLLARALQDGLITVDEL